jgi:hypothetical protein
MIKGGNVKFEQKPHNDFPRFVDTYFERCLQVCPKIRAVSGKWRFQDLIPGLSDFDTRFIFTSDVTIEEWLQMSVAVGRVHTQLAKEFPQWARILEHLPGINLTHAELVDPVFYYPEFQQWTYYRGEQEILDSIKSYLTNKPWHRRDELFHLKKFANYYGPYLRWIDPPINIGKWENKYALHSRFMHYFTPPVQSAMSLVRRKGVCGKLEALHKAREVFPNSEVIDMVLDAINHHYQVPEYYNEPKLTEIERTLESYLRGVYAALAEHITLIQVEPADTPQVLKNKIAQIPIDPAEQFYEGARFSRFIKGRLLFYATQIPWFDSTRLIQVEFERFAGNYYEKPLTAFGLVWFNKVSSPEAVLARLSGDVLTRKICDGVKEFMRVIRLPLSDGQEKKRAKEVADIFEPVHIMIEILSSKLRDNLKARD